MRQSHFSFLHSPEEAFRLSCLEPCDNARVQDSKRTIYITSLDVVIYNLQDYSDATWYSKFASLATQSSFSFLNFLACISDFLTVLYDLLLVLFISYIYASHASVCMCVFSYFPVICSNAFLFRYTQLAKCQMAQSVGISVVRSR